MRGRSTHPTGQEKEGDGATSPSFYKERLGTESPPHPSPSVTASPQGEASGSCSPTRKKRSKSGYADGHRNSPTIAPLRPTTPKPASGNERAIKLGVQGACPRPSFSPFLGRNGDPAGQAGPRGAAPRGTGRVSTTRRVRSTVPHSRPGPGGKPRRRAHPAKVPTGPPTNDGGPRQRGPAKPPTAFTGPPVPQTAPRWRRR